MSALVFCYIFMLMCVAVLNRAIRSLNTGLPGLFFRNNQNLMSSISATLINRLLLIFLYFSPMTSVYAGIVEMPNVEEAPTLHGKSIYENYNIPSVISRNPDPTDGPRLWVKDIRLQGIDDFPALGIRTIEVMAYIEKLRFELMRENEIEEYGYSKKELADIAKLLNKIDTRNNYEHVTTPDLQRFIWLVRSQKEERGLSIGEIEGIAEKVKQYYRSRGLQLAEAFVPRQAMRDGIVTITVIPAKLGTVEVVNNHLYDDETITSVFDDILTEPVSFDRISERTYLLNDYPGLIITGQLNAGYQVGDSKLVLSTADEQAFEGTLRLDNHGSELTGDIRGFAQFYWNNAMGIADQFNLAILKTTSPDNSTYGLIGYRLPVYNSRLHLGLSASTNQFILDQSRDTSGLNLKGKTKQSGIDLEYVFKRSRAASWWGFLIYDTTETILDEKEFGNLGLDDKIKNIRLSANFDLLNSESKILHLGSLTLTAGKFVYGEGDGRDQQYSKFNADYTLMTFVPLAWFESSTRFLVKSRLQFSDNPLPAAEQQALASPTTVRAYPINQFSGDTTYYLGFEWVFNTPVWLTSDWLSRREIYQKLQPILFVDAAHGIQNTLTGADPVKGTLVDVGFGFQYGYGKNLSGNMQFAFPVHDDFSINSITVPDDSIKIVFDLQYRL